MKNAVILLSGGLDSTTTLALAKSQGYSVYALSIYYGQRNNIELKAAERVGKHFNVLQHKFIDLDLRLFGGSSLTDAIPVLAHAVQAKNQIPNTYVPARNTILLSLALAYAEVVKAQDIFYGANIHDYSGYPDCRPEYIRAFETMANLATKNADNGHRITIHTPLVDMTKAEIINLGLSLKVDYALTLSCYDPIDNIGCGVCSACFYRHKGFDELGMKDPAIKIMDEHENQPSVQ